MHATLIVRAHKLAHARSHTHIGAHAVCKVGRRRRRYCLSLARSRSCTSRKPCRRQTDSKSGTEPGARGALDASLRSRSSNEKDLLAAILSRSCGLLARPARLLQKCRRKAPIESTVKHCLPARLKLPHTRSRRSLSPSLPESGSTLTGRGYARSLTGRLLDVLLGQSARS